MLDTENRCKSSLAFSHLRWTVGVRVVLLKRSIAPLLKKLHLQRYFLPPPIKVVYEPFVLHSILLAQTLDNWTLS